MCNVSETLSFFTFQNKKIDSIVRDLYLICTFLVAVSPHVAVSFSHENSYFSSWILLFLYLPCIATKSFINLHCNIFFAYSFQCCLFITIVSLFYIQQDLTGLWIVTVPVLDISSKYHEKKTLCNYWTFERSILSNMTLI